MAPKRRAASAAKAGGKKVKEEPDAFISSKEGPLAAGPQIKGKRKVDKNCPLSSSGKVYEDYDCMLKQTNVGHNNNKFYVIQIIKANKKYYSWNRWGRVGKVGQNYQRGPFKKPEDAIKVFEKKFKDKTKNKWSDRMNFVPQNGKYTLIEVEREDVRPCTLDAATQKLIALIFNDGIFEEAMECMNLDIKNGRLNKLSKKQIAKGVEVMKEIEAAVRRNKRTVILQKLSSKFFTIVPHDFGRKRPPTIDTEAIVEKKKDMLDVLADIELAQTLKSETEKAQEEMKETVPHPIDQCYNSLKCNLTLMDKRTKRFKIIEKYLNATAGENHKLKMINVWEVDRETEGQSFSENDKLENRHLLWHGTDVAKVVAILKSGLRIMPKSGGRVGRGIYFASESCLSADYALSKTNIRVMFLCEVALGKEHTITQDDPTLKEAPAGYDSVVARGRVEPDPSKDVVIILEGKKVTVPQGKAVRQPQFSKSHFKNSEYLTYKESQCRIRYILELEKY